MIKLKNKRYLGNFRKNRVLITRIVLVLSIAITIFIIFLLVGELNKIFEKDFILSDNDPRLEFYRSFVPLRRWEINKPAINANGVLVVLIKDGKEKFLFEKDSETSFPIASITKLMTAVIALQKYELDHQIIVSEKAFLKDLHRPNNLFPGETYKVRDLLYSNLMESGNTAAYALAEGRTIFEYNRTADSFIAKMNQKAQSLGMEKTYFSNPTGLDPLIPGIGVNRSSPRDLLLLAKYLIDYPLIWEILSTKEYDLRTADGTLKYRMKNTNELLYEKNFIKGGKTGQTWRAGGNLFAIFKRDDGYLFTVVLGSNDRFRDTKTLLNWIEKAYHWKVI